MARPGRYDLNMYRGDTYAWRFDLWSDPAQTVPVDLTGVAVKSEIRDEPGGVIYVELDTSVSGNTVLVQMHSDQWLGWTARNAVWDLQLTYTPDRVVTIIAGVVTVTPDVTDSTPISLLMVGPQAQQLSLPAPTPAPTPTNGSWFLPGQSS